MQGFFPPDTQALPRARAGSYTLNHWLFWYNHSLLASWDDFHAMRYALESHVATPSRTPLLADGIMSYTYPLEFEEPSGNLFFGGLPVGGGAVLQGGSMTFVAIARHGTHPKIRPTVDWPINRR